MRVKVMVKVKGKEKEKKMMKEKKVVGVVEQIVFYSGREEVSTMT